MVEKERGVEGDAVPYEIPDAPEQPLDILYSTAPVRPCLGTAHRATLSPLDEKLARNASLAGRLQAIDPRAASRLRACHPKGRRCKLSKLCSFCGLDRTGRLVRRYKVRLDQLARPVHLTLTSYPIERLTRAALQDGKERFRHLREGRRFGRTVRGGVANVEVKRGRAGWLVHIHAVLDVGVGVLPLGAIKKEWQRLGGGQQLEQKNVEKGTAHNVFAYSAQAPDLPEDSVLLAQFYREMRGFRPVSVWGSLHHHYGRPLGAAGASRP